MIYVLHQFQYQLKTFTEARNKVWASEPYSSEYYSYVFNMYLKIKSISIYPSNISLSITLILQSLPPFSVPDSLHYPIVHAIYA